MLTVGVLALQGDFAAHERAVARTGHRSVAVTEPRQLEEIDALVLPGGESTTMLRLIRAYDFAEPIRRFCRSERPVLGTCAGAILLARSVTSPAQESLGVLDVEVERNGYGRQLESFITHAAPGNGPWEGMEMVFIRAPIIWDVGPGVRVLIQHDDHPVLVEQDGVFAATFHPEMTDDPRVLEHVVAASPVG